MAKKLRFYDVIDIKAILIASGIIVGICLIYLAFLYNAQIIAHYKLRSYDSRTTGEIMSVEPVSYMSQSRLGSKLSMHHYTISYSYVVNGVNLTGVEDISANNYNTSKLKAAMKEQNQIVVAYKTDRPEKSAIDLTE